MDLSEGGGIFLSWMTCKNSIANNITKTKTIICIITLQSNKQKVKTAMNFAFNVGTRTSVSQIKSTVKSTSNKRKAHHSDSANETEKEIMFCPIF